MELQNLKHTFDNHKDEIAEKVKLTFEKNDSHIQNLQEENKSLKREYQHLQECVNRLELSQLCNNIIITGMSEQNWQPYKTTK